MNTILPNIFPSIIILEQPLKTPYSSILYMVTIRTQVKDLLKENGMDNMSADFLDSLDNKVKQLVLDAVKRAKENGRRTVMCKDV